MNNFKYLRFGLFFVLLSLVACGPAVALVSPSATTLQPTNTSQSSTITYASGQVESLDMATVKSDLTHGFAQGFLQGDYVYFIPANWTGEIKPSYVIRVDKNNFTQSGTSVVDLAVGYLDNTSVWGSHWSFTDGQSGYFTALGGEVTRLDLQNFDSKGLTQINLNAKYNDSIYDMNGGFTDGKYAYFGSTYGLIRVDLLNFNLDGAEFLDTKSIDNSLYLVLGCTDGHYGYFLPQEYANVNAYGVSNSSKVVRIDLQNFTSDGITILDLIKVDPNMKILWGRFVNDGFLYLASNSNSKIVRIDTQNFETDGVTVLDLSTLDNGLKGYVSAFTDGKYGYFLPNAGKEGDIYQGTGKIARVDLSTFSLDDVTWLDLTHLNAGWNNFMDGMADSQYIYLDPGNGIVKGIQQNTSVVRISLDYPGWEK
jgi:hypothetical protein